MFCKIAVLAGMIVIIPAVQSEAHAGGHTSRYRALDDLTFAAYVEARELRWEIHDDFVDSHDYDHLLEDADVIVAAIHKIQKLVYAERPEGLIAREVDSTKRHVSNLTSHLSGSDFALTKSRNTQTQLNRRGYSFTPETQHVGRVHVDAALRMIARLQTALENLDHEVHHIAPRSRHRHDPVVLPEAPAPVVVPRKTNFRGSYRMEIPVGNQKVAYIRFNDFISAQLKFGR